MKILLKTVLLLSIVSFVAGCGDKKDEGNTAGKSDTAKTIAKTEKVSPRFEQILKHVPADTSYLYANKNVLTNDLLDAYMKISRQYLAMLAEEIKPSEKDADSKDSDDSQKQLLFTHLLIKSFAASLDVKNNTSGIDFNGHEVLYGYNLAPVLRVELSDSKALLALIKKAEADSENKLSWTKCGKSDCIVGSNEKASFAFIVSDKLLTVSAFQNQSKDEMMTHLTSNKMPEKSYSVANWDKFLAEHSFKGFGDGFINLADTYKQAEKLFFANTEGNADDLSEQKACSALVNKHLVNMPSLAFGSTDLQVKSVSYEFILKTSETVTTALKKIPNPLEGYKVAENPTADFGLNLNFGHLKNALMSYSEFLIESNKDNCSAIKPAEIRKMVGSLAMATMFGVDKFKSIYFAINNVTLTDSGKPENIEVYASIGADDPASLVQMLAMVDPKFAMIKLPEDGSAIKLPAELLKSKVPGDVPDVFLSTADKQLNIMLGDKEPKKKAFKAELPTLFWSSLDGQRYTDIIVKVLEQQSNGKDKSQLESMKKLYATMGNAHQRLVVDDRGLVWKYQTHLIEK
ncbi:MAG: hypothetical protein KAH22_01265 [Thiotrichaceae bacterium]|nr:hypothetical protein [Thiotrichaceae bacterium]